MEQWLKGAVTRLAGGKLIRYEIDDNMEPIKPTEHGRNKDRQIGK